MRIAHRGERRHAPQVRVPRRCHLPSSELPSSGNSATRVKVRVGPTPGTAQQFLLLPPHRTLSKPLAQVVINLLQLLLQQRQHSVDTHLDDGLLAGPARRPSSALPADGVSPGLRVLAQPLRAGRGSTSAAWPKCAITSASIRSVLASLPRERAKSRTWRGFTTAIGKPEAPKAAAIARTRPMPPLSRGGGAAAADDL